MHDATFTQPRWEVLFEASLGSREESNVYEVDLEDILEIFERIGVNKPLLEDLKKDPKEAPLKVLTQAFLKKIHQELNGGMATRQSTIDFGGSNYILRAQKLSPKMKDPGSFNIPCVIGGLTIDHAICDLWFKCEHHT